MNGLAEAGFPDFFAPGVSAAFVLTALRVGGLVLVAPVWSAQMVPMRLRAALIVIFALILTPAATSGVNLDALRITPASFLAESAIGLVIGLAAAMFIAGAEAAGEQMTVSIGLSGAAIFDPVNNTQGAILAEFMKMVALVVLLIAGANMPEQIADRFNVSKVPLILALVLLVGISLINYVVKLMPTGLEPKPKAKSPEGVRAMFYAIEKGNLVYAQKVIGMDFDPNLHHDNGYTPLAYAAMKGNPQMVELFLRNGANPALTTKEGDTPVELALRFGHGEVADMLKRARQEIESREAGTGVPESPRQSIAA